jgi:gliding motility-associated-like protein
VVITVNPTPHVNVSATAQTICNDAATSVTLTSPSTFTTGVIKFRYTVSATGGVTGFTTPVNNLANNYVIADVLNNPTDAPQTVTYTIYPVSPTGCAEGTPKVVVVTVNPTPKVNVSVTTQTICNDAATNVTLTSPSTFSSGVIKFRYTVTATGGVTGFTTPVNNLSNNYVIADILNNPTDAPQTVTYTIYPVSPTGCAEGAPKVVVVTVNPTPQVNVSTSTQTICNVGTTSVTLTSPSTFSSGVIKFRYTVTATGGVTGFTTPVNNLSDNHVIEDVLNNPTDAPQTVTYTIYPVSPTGCPEGPSKTVVITVNPTPRVSVSVSTQTICNNAATNVTLSSPSTFTTGVIKFRYTVTATGGVTGFTTPSSDLPNNHTIADVLNNPTDAPQTVTYTIYPVSPTGCSEGPPKTVVITINPTPLVNVSETTQIICNNAATNVMLTSPSTFSLGVIRFRYTVTATGGVTGFTTPVSNLPNNYVIADMLYNPTNAPQTVTYTIYPVSPTGCPDGLSKVVVITVNPTPQVNVSTSTQTICDDGTTNVTLTSPSTFSSGEIKFRYSVTATGGITGFTTPSTDLPNTHVIADVLNNPTDAPQTATYTIYPVSPTGCPEGPSKTVVITVNPTPKVNLSAITQTICNDAATSVTLTSPSTFSSGVIKFRYTVTATGGITGFATPVNSLSNNHVIDDVLNNPTDAPQTVTYTIYPVSPTGCSDGPSKEFTVTVLPSVKFEFKDKQYIGGKNIRCYGESNGSLKAINIRGGLATGYHILWNTGETIDSIRNKPAGAYSVTVTDYMGCSASQNFTLTQPNLLTHSLIVTNVKCIGMNTGSMNLGVTGGTGPMNYLWTWNADTTKKWYTEDVDSLYSGVYNIAITDANGCTDGETNITLRAPLPFDWAHNKSQYGKFNISCNGANDGIINPIFFNEIKGYSWEGPNGFTSTSRMISDLKPGKYTLTVLDANGCYTVGRSDTIFEPTPVIINADIHQYPNNYNLQCDGGSNGNIDLSVQGGHSNYQYVWSSSNGSGIAQGTQDQNSITAGDFMIEVRDKYLYRNVEYFCSHKDTFTLSEPPHLLLDTVITRYSGFEIDCKNNKTGAINISVSGGYGTYSYQWSTLNGSGMSAGSEDQANLGAGTYDLKVLYGDQCEKDYSFKLKEPDIITLDSVLSNYNGFNVSCYRSSNGSININPKGAVAPYSYLWSTTNGAGLIPASADQSNLSAGNYQLRITDINNCTYNWDIPVIQPDSIHITPKIEDIQCSGQGNGKIEAIVRDGAGNYSYLWSTGATTSTITNVRVEDYSVTVTDQNGCVKNAVAHVSAPDPLDIRVEKKDISCIGRIDGSIALSVNGGRSPFMYEWSNGDNQSQLVNLPPSTYSVRVTDWGGCVGNAIIQIIEPDSLKVNYSKTDVTCNNKATGRIELQPSGGTAPYYYMWSNGYRGRVAEGLKAGNHLAVVRDANNCPYDIAVSLTQPEPIVMAKIITRPFCPDTEDGSIEVSATGGTGALYYSWNNGSSLNQIQNIPEGYYIVTVTDEENCTLKDTTLLEATTSGCVDIPTAFSPNGDGVNDTWDIRAGSPVNPTNSVRDLYPEAVMEVFNRWGVLIFKSTPGYTDDWDGSWKDKKLPVDSYFYIFDLRNGKKPLTGNVTIIR